MNNSKKKEFQKKKYDFFCYYSLLYHDLNDLNKQFLTANFC